MAFKLCTYILVDMRKPVLEKKTLYLQVSPSRRFVKGNGRNESRIENYHREVGIFKRKISRRKKHDFDHENRYDSRKL